MYLMIVASTRNDNFWIHADTFLSGALDWRLVASSPWLLASRVVTRFALSFMVNDSFDARLSSSSHIMLWELNPAACIEDVETSITVIRAYSDCFCTVVPTSLVDALRVTPKFPFAFTFDLGERRPIEAIRS